MQNFITLKTHYQEKISAHIILVGMPNFGIYKEYGTPINTLNTGLGYYGGYHIRKIVINNLEDGIYRFTEAKNERGGETVDGFLKIIGGTIVDKSNDLESLIKSTTDKLMLEAQKLRGQEIAKEWEEKENAAKIARDWEEKEKAIRKNNKKIKKIKKLLEDESTPQILTL